MHCLWIQIAVVPTGIDDDDDDDDDVFDVSRLVGSTRHCVACSAGQ